ncbi:MAG: hypothetical protein GF329_20095 [Candidatus Lokiarchaeota archaeon]|nr:hypothetical protein [Candidatus Lokiarchaeota archaeon]
MKTKSKKKNRYIKYIIYSRNILVSSLIFAITMLIILVGYADNPTQVYFFNDYHFISLSVIAIIMCVSFAFLAVFIDIKEVNRFLRIYSKKKYNTNNLIIILLACISTGICTYFYFYLGNSTLEALYNPLFYLIFIMIISVSNILVFVNSRFETEFIKKNLKGDYESEESKEKKEKWSGTPNRKFIRNEYFMILALYFLVSCLFLPLIIIIILIISGFPFTLDTFLQSLKIIGPVLGGTSPIAVFGFLYFYYVKRNSRYKILDDRIVLNFKFIKHTISEVQIKDIKSIKVRKTIMEKILNSSTHTIIVRMLGSKLDPRNKHILYHLSDVEPFLNQIERMNPDIIIK